MWKGTHTCCGQKIKLGPLYIIHYFNGRLKWEIWSICLVSLKDQEETTMSLLHAEWIKKLGKRQWRGHMETWWRAVWAVSSPEYRHIMKTPVISHYLIRNITLTCMLKQIVVQGFYCCNRILWLAVCCPSCAHTLMYLPICSIPLLSGGLVQHCECGRPRPSSVWQYVRPQQLKTRSESSQTGARRVSWEYYGIWWDTDTETQCHTSFIFFISLRVCFIIHTQRRRTYWSKALVRQII